MTHVLFGRNLRLNVALTLWRKNASELVAYLNRLEICHLQDLFIVHRYVSICKKACFVSQCEHV